MSANRKLDLWELSPEQLKTQLVAEFEENREDLLQADRDAAWLYAQNLAFIAEMETEDESESDCDAD
ncbi:hypothetical protein KJ836_03705 [Patescibacteria group bacterium]|nr:hypothetical protein [Patescibacteria group bacterium]